MKIHNKKILECNRACLKFFNTNETLYEEESCLKSCLRKINEIENCIDNHIKEWGLYDLESQYVNPYSDKQ